MDGPGHRPGNNLRSHIANLKAHGSDHFLQTSYRPGGAIVVPELTEYVSRKLHQESQILQRKQAEMKGKHHGKGFQWRSRIFHEPCSDGRARDVLPLPMLQNVEAVQGSVCRAVRRRLQKRSAVAKMVNRAIYSLNSLYLGRHWEGSERVTNFDYLFLHKCSILGHTTSCRGRVGAFCVTKKPKEVAGQLVERQRLILDCRQVNLAFRDPPKTELGSLAALPRFPQNFPISFACAAI